MARLQARRMAMRMMALVMAVGCAVGMIAATGAAQDAETVYVPGKDVTAPRVVKEVKPLYTAEARSAKVQGTIGLDVVVLKDGRVGDVRVTRSLDAGLDEQAVKAVKQWEFEPGKKDGKPVPVRVDVEMTFTLK
jgi:periplasmic protein TonB